MQSDPNTVDLFVAGVGAVGETLLQKLARANPTGVRFRLLGVCNSQQVLWDDSGISLKAELDWSEANKTDWSTILEKLKQTFRRDLLFIDATGSEEVARFYPGLIQRGVHIITPSKLANTFEQAFFDTLQREVNKSKASFRYETTVGAGLPVISTITDLQKSGDKIQNISGVVSGTMTYVFNQLEEGIPFSKAIISARELGYAEPDPRDDLSGEDVARKFLTLARTLGYKMERDELEVESLVPTNLLSVDQPTFLKRLGEHDDSWTRRLEEAQKSGKTLRYTGTLSDGEITIGVQSVAVDSPIGQLKGTDNLFQIYSKFYNKTPLVIQGPGAGKEVTAAGVLSDILKTSTTIV